MKKNMKSVLFYAASVAALMLAASCSKENVASVDEPAAPSVHTIEVTVPVGVETKASYAEKMTTIQEGDKLYLEVSKTGEGAYTYVGLLDCIDATTGTFSGELAKKSGSEFSSTDIISDCTALAATLLPKDYNENYYKLTKEGETVTGLTIDPSEAFFAGAKGDAVPQVANASYTYTSDKTITLTAQNAVLFYALDHLAKSSTVFVTVSDGSNAITGNVTTDADGKGTFAVGFAGGAGSKDYTLSITGKDSEKVTAALDKNRVYNVTRTIYPANTIHGIFSVSPDQQVYFSKGNLQATYGSSSWTWAFAAHQWDFIGDDTTPTGNGNIVIDGDGMVSSDNVTVDLFGWVGASNTSWTGAAKYGISNSTTTNKASTYGNGASEALRSDWGNTMSADWAVLTGASTTAWRTLTKDEWVYLINADNADQYRQLTIDGYKKAPYGQGTVNGVNGLIILPDDWDGSVHSGFTYGKSSWSNIYTEETTPKWSEMEAAGAVFLPAAGYRKGTTVSNSDLRNDKRSYYWSSTPRNATSAYELYFDDSMVNPANYSYRYFGRSVRLVQNQ